MLGILDRAGDSTSVTLDQAAILRATHSARPDAGWAFCIPTVLALAFAPVSTALSQSLAAMDATALVRRAVQNRLDAEKNHRLMRYVLHRTDEHHDTTKEILRRWTATSHA